MAACATCVFLWTGSEALRIGGADWRSSQVRLQVTRWASGEQKWTPEEWQQALTELQRALTKTPEDAVLHEHVALLYTLEGQARWGDGGAESPGVAAYRQAVIEQKKALALRPRQAQAWANLATMLYAIDAPADEGFAAWRKALELGPNEPEVKTSLRALAELTWPIAPQDVLDWLERDSPGRLAQLRAEAATAASAPASAAAAR